MVQEGLTNIGKHAQASRAQVSLGIRPEAEDAKAHRRMLVLTIEDDGRGAGAQAATSADGGTGLGLIGMRERAAALGGHLDVVRLEQGFRLQAMIPVAAEAEAAE
jgi:signal transduction histidine kinase